VATGAAQYPTPTGAFEIVVMERNPTWNPPDSDWAEGAKPIPPGPGNPLGTRWMGISAPAVGIHGTPDAASLGYSASHGCIRMAIPEAEWLFDHVEVGTPVYIVAA
jgi:lipoprotein-anchoring transpeptidase ErfK/SrfK